MKSTARAWSIAVVASTFAPFVAKLDAQVRIEPAPATATPSSAPIPLTHWVDKLWSQNTAPPSTPPLPLNTARCPVVVVLPDSLALVSGPGGVGTFDVWDNDVAHWAVLLPPPTAIDTLRVRVVGADCGVIPLRIWVQAGTRYLAVYPSDAVPKGMFIIGPKGRLERASLTISDGPDGIRVDSLPASFARRYGPVPTAEESRELRIAALPRRDRALVRNHEVRIGMSDDAARISWGEPDRVNVTVIAGHREEQWVYSLQRYLYFENGVLTAIQY